MGRQCAALLRQVTPVIGISPYVALQHLFEQIFVQCENNFVLQFLLTEMLQSSMVIRQSQTTTFALPGITVQ